MTGYFHQEENVDEYIKMAEGYDGHELITEFAKLLPRDSSVLEIGMGPGTDLTILRQYYQVTGSDYSEIFVNRYQEANPDEDLLVLDAQTLKTDLKFQGVYSNKVLIHLTRDALSKSIKRQAEVLEPDGIICHSFWHGNKEEIYDGLLFMYYTADELQSFFETEFEIMKIEKYSEIEQNDSIYLIARKK